MQDQRTSPDLQEPKRRRGMDQVWIDAVAASKDASLRDRDAAIRQRNRYREALEEIASDLGHPGDPAWRRAMEALGRDADAAERAWHD